MYFLITCWQGGKVPSEMTSYSTIAFPIQALLTSYLLLCVQRIFATFGLWGHLMATAIACNSVMYCSSWKYRCYYVIANQLTIKLKMRKFFSVE